MYFKPCGRAGCQGCLNRLRGKTNIFLVEFEIFVSDFQFSPRHLNNLVNDNPVESQIIQVFLKSQRNLISSQIFLGLFDKLSTHNARFTCSML